MARLTDDAGETSVNVLRPWSGSENYHAYIGLRTRYVPLSLPTNMTKLRKQDQTTHIHFYFDLLLATWPVPPGDLVELIYLICLFISTRKGGDVTLLKQMVQKGMLGRKSGAGLFTYDGPGGKSTRSVNPEASSMLEQFLILPKVENTPEHVQFRLLTRFVNEAVLCLQDGILINGPVEGDIGAVFGLGFPPYLGGKSNLGYCECPIMLN
ncbi:unnamed protein product [Protopolystoma xenopodis]|uniref:3-hydroxyacyl-CoA dehydrogenase C-terminal domain-containing protein n=1 Tax=Protopolystoma xenopodis TaxID=117903 RepID=A0A448XMM0_9PLAT|nr:unnamed protein product [Protopolystoma xenopodis]